MHRKPWIILVFVWACQPSGGIAEVYPDLEVRTSAMAQQLSSRPHDLVKIASMDGVTDTLRTTNLDSSRWAAELRLIAAANFNRAVYRDLYKVEDRPDENSNLTIRTFTYTGQGKTNVPFMEVRYLNDPEQWRSAYIQFHDDNAGFVAHREIRINFEEFENNLWPSGYRIEGFQKILGQDTVRFDIEAEITY